MKDRAQLILALLTIATSVSSVILSPLYLDALAGAYALLAVAVVAAGGVLTKWNVFPDSQTKRRFVKVVLFLIVIAIAAVWVRELMRASQPHFEITAFRTLEPDDNAYELTDMLIWNQNNPDKYGVGITFTIQIRPSYYGTQRFGKVIALISGESNSAPLEKPLWDDFTKQSNTQPIHLTLAELVSVSGLKPNSDPPYNPFGVDGISFRQVKLTVQVVREGDKAHPWDSAAITIRNAPWDMRSVLEWRNGGRELDVYVKNLGGTGEFTVRYHLVRLNEEIGSNSAPMNNGTTTISGWNAPTPLVTLKQGEFFTDTARLPDGLDPGRYLIEAYAVKKQNFVQFNYAATWENLNSLNTSWWFGQWPTNIHIFVVGTPEIVMDSAIQIEWERLRNQQGIDLGHPTGVSEAITSTRNTVGQRQVFQKGEIYAYNGQAYSIYGPILEHYTEEGGADQVGLPISPIQQVTSNSGTLGDMMAFEGSTSSRYWIYTSKKGTAAVTGWFGSIYTTETGGHEGWLGFPLADTQDYANSVSQMFEFGYFVYYFPQVGDTRDWNRKPVAYPYLASRGTLFDVHAEKQWQNTGVRVETGDQITIVQVGGSWSNSPKVALFDANGEPNVSLEGNMPLASVVSGTLIGKIGEDDSHMLPIGRWRVLTAPVDGVLYLSMNSSSYEDNSGFITVQITIEH